MRPLLVFGVLVCLALVYISHVSASEHEDAEDDEEFLEPEQAKTLLRVKRGWRRRRFRVRFRVKRITGEERREEGKRRERSREASHRAWLASNCPRTCWAAWGGWTGCSAPCGNNGLKTRSRQRRPPQACVAWVNAHGCPGPSSETTECNRFCHNGGAAQPGRCNCKAGFKGTCCEHRVTCGFPGKPTHGGVSPSSSSSFYNTVAKFTCSTGYRLVGPSSRTCQNNGQWSNSVPQCHIIKCPDPGVQAHGTRAGSDFTYGKAVVYTCNNGYRISGTARLVCGANGGWSGARPTCQPVPCQKLAAPSGGKVNIPANPVFGSVATFSCNTGYYQQGSAKRTCQASGKWDGSAATCNRITCAKLQAPSNGAVNQGTAAAPVYGQVATYTCHQGYQLSGGSRRSCGGSGPTGTWSGNQPACNPVSCGDPGRPSNGVKLGNTHTYLSKVTYQCLPGYYMAGASTVTCQASKKWSAGKPTCTGCAKNSYKAGSNTLTSCTKCPANSHTKNTASADVKMCECDVTYRGPPGGPCQEIRCPALGAPKNGKITTCNTRANGACGFDCTDGYILGSGDSRRQCSPQGSWSGAQPICAACLLNTYKASSNKCEKCPPNSHTTKPAQMKRGCVCNTGYRGPPGGQCSDIDECASGNGRCEQKCRNTAGSYRCECDIPGFIVDSKDKLRCFEKFKCEDFPSPDNGGAVCNVIRVTNTRRCQVKCNPGYEHLETPNLFEECGANTNWRWSYEVRQDEITPCIEQLFPGVVTAAEVFYLAKDCTKMTTAYKIQVRSTFVNMLRKQGLCKKAGKDVCNINDVNIQCGSVDDFGFGGRVKRSVKNVIQIKFHIQVPEVPAKNVGCVKNCDMVNNTMCVQSCRKSYTKESEGKITAATDKLKHLYENSPTNGPTGKGASTKPTLMINGKPMEPATSKVMVGQMKTSCKRGEAPRNGLCVACPAGTYASDSRKTCVPCAKGRHQPRPRQTRCLPCPPRSTTQKLGARACVVISHVHR